MLRFEPAAPVKQGAVMRVVDADAGKPAYLSVPLVLDDEHKASAANWHSIVATWALSRMATLKQHQPALPALADDHALQLTSLSLHMCECLHSILTPWLAGSVVRVHQDVSETCQRLQVSDPEAVASVAFDKASALLHILAMRSETAMCLWTPHMRTQVLDLVSEHEGKGLAEARHFVFKDLKDELCVSGVYLRTIVNVPDMIASVVNRGRLAHCILSFLAAKCPVQAASGQACSLVAVPAAKDWDTELDDSILDVQHDEYSGRVLSSYEWDTRRWQQDAVLALSALGCLAARDMRLQPQQLEQQQQQPPASTLHILRWLPLLWVLVTEQHQGGGVAGLVAETGLGLLLDVARQWPDLLSSALTTDSHSQAKRLFHFVRTCKLSQLRPGTQRAHTLTHPHTYHPHT
jgi:hypothetical protein